MLLYCKQAITPRATPRSTRGRVGAQSSGARNDMDKTTPVKSVKPGKAPVLNIMAEELSSPAVRTTRDTKAAREANSRQKSNKYEIFIVICNSI